MPENTTSVIAGDTVGVQSEEFLDHVAGAHARFLDAMTAAQYLLAGHAGELSEVAAHQSKLSRQFLDAQRGLLRQRAATDGEVARIAVEAARRAAEVRAKARPSPSLIDEGVPSVVELPTGEALIGACLPTAPPSCFEAEAFDLIRLVDGARAADADLAESELRLVLDSWWGRERDARRAALDDAEARAAVVLHLARVERSADVEPPPATVPTVADLGAVEPPSTGEVPPTPVATTDRTTSPEGPAEPGAADVSPDDMARPDGADAIDLEASPGTSLLAVLEHTGEVPLDDLLAEMLTMLDASAPEAAEPDTREEAAAEPPGAVQVPETSEEAFDRFWRSHRGHGRGSDWLLMQVAFPIVAVVAVLALILAAIG